MRVQEEAAVSMVIAEPMLLVLALLDVLWLTLRNGMSCY